jgi:hypothetical protein
MQHKRRKHLFFFFSTFYSFKSFRDLFTYSLFYCTYTTEYYYELTKNLTLIGRDQSDADDKEVRW